MRVTVVNGLSRVGPDSEYDPYEEVAVQGIGRTARQARRRARRSARQERRADRRTNRQIRRGARTTNLVTGSRPIDALAEAASNLALDRIEDYSASFMGGRPEIMIDPNTGQQVLVPAKGGGWSGLDDNTKTLIVGGGIVVGVVGIAALAGAFKKKPKRR